MSEHPQIETLRRAAHERDADTLQFTLKQVFQKLDFVVALGIAAEQAYRYVDTFEQYHPEEVWPRRMLMLIVTTATAPERQIIEEAFKHFETPGSANFIKAMYDLYQGTQETNQSQARLGFLVSAVVNAITAELVELYFGKRPEQWTAYRAQAENAPQIAMDFWTNEAVSQQDTKRWLAVADAVEKRLDR